MSYFEEKLSADIVRKVSIRLGDLDFRVLRKSDFACQTEGIKDCVASGVNEIRILADNRFEIDLSPTDFSRVVTKDYSDGLSRVRSLSDTYSVVLNSDACSAWQIVTLYYIGFFSAIEILRASGEYVSYFDSGVVEIVAQSASVNAGQVEAGSYQGVAKYNESSGTITICYVKSNIRHHQHAWSSVAALAQSSFKSRDKDEREIISRVVGALGRSGRNVKGVSPSDTRNHWNYEDPTLFGKNGCVASANLVKLMKNPGAPLKWVRKKSNLLDFSSATCALGFCSEFLKSVLEGLSKRIVPE